MKLLRFALALLLLFSACAVPLPVLAQSSDASANQADLPAFPRGFAFAGITKEGANGQTLYYCETAPSENGLVMGVWFNESGKEVLQAETLPALSRSTRKRAQAVLPESYDARNENLLTPVKYQKGNTCWAYAAVACMEANAIKKGIATADSIDLSEGHLVWFGRNAYFPDVTDPRNDGLSAASAAEAVSKGGNSSYAERALKNFAGPANESDYPVDTTNENTFAESLENTMTFADRFSRAYDFVGVRRFASDETTIKNAVLTYGAAEQYFYTENAYYTHRVPVDDAERALPATYFYPDDVPTAQINHAVVIVGWDDSFSKELFGGDVKPEHDGAWLCRNSWSTAFGNNGYFWMSYENHGCYNAVNVYEIAEKDPSVTVQYYDGCGSMETLKNVTAAANIFTASGNVTLRAVSLGVPMQDYDFSVYTGLTAMSYPKRGTCIYTQSGNAGGSTVIGLEGKVQLSAGERYSVVFSSLNEVPVEGANLNNSGNRFRFTSGRYQSFYEIDGDWTDCSSNAKNNVCIRAFEKLQSAPPYTVTFACPEGGFETKVTTETNTVALPAPPEGYVYAFTCDGAVFDGTNVTQDITVRTHCYPAGGTVSTSDPCRVEFRCKFCGREAAPAEMQHTLQTNTHAPTATAPGYTMQSCIYGDFGQISDLVLKEGASGGLLGSAFAWQLCGDVLSVAGVGELPDFTSTQPAPWKDAAISSQAKRFVVGEGITALGALTCSGLINLTEIVLPATLQSVDDSAFGGSLTSLQNVRVAEESTAFRSDNGILMSADGAEMFLYPANKPGAVYQIPKAVTRFAPYCFAGNRNIAYLDLFLCTANRIPDYFCSNAAVLRHVNLPYASHTIGTKAFFNENGLISVIFIRNNVTMPQSDVFGNSPKIMINSSSSPVKIYALNYNNEQYQLLSSHNGNTAAVHKYTAGTETFAAACDVPAYTVNLCECGNFSVSIGEAPGHSFGDWQNLNDAEHFRVCENNASHVETADHTWDSGVVTTEPTCTEQGVKTFTCTACGAEKTAPVEALNHRFGNWQPYSETQHRRVCENNASHVEIADHTWDSGSVTAQPTCTEQGVKTFTCTVCGAKKTAPVEALNHRFGNWQPYSETQHSRVCENNASHVETADHTWDSGVVTTEPTCTEQGVKTFTCTACGAEKTAPVEALNHRFGNWQPYSETQHSRVCENNASHVETADHTWDSGVVTTEPTCTEQGVKTFTCTVCGAEKTAPVEALNHRFGNWQPYSETQHSRVCENNASHVETADHTWDSGVVTTEPTCTEQGVKTFTCTACGAEKTAPVEALNHRFGNWQPYSETQHSRVCENNASHVETADHTWDSGSVTTQPTCTEQGVKTFTCTACGKTKTARISALGHTSPNAGGDCERCGTHLKDLPDPNACPYCGETHSGMFGWLVKLFHNFFFRLFGKK